MREDSLLAMQPRQFIVTTDSDHPLEVYLNLARRMKLTGIDQLWVADITYIRLRTEFVYLALVLDGFSRRVVGWALQRGLSSRSPSFSSCRRRRRCRQRLDRRKEAPRHLFPVGSSGLRAAIATGRDPHGPFHIGDKCS